MADAQPFDVVDLGEIGYEDARRRQRQELDAVVAGTRTRGVVLLCRHPHVVTVGRAGRREPEANLIGGAAALEAAGVELVVTDRGGDVTYHGPGQLVAYPILPLWQFRRSAEWYLRTLEQAVIKALGEGFGLSAQTVPDRTGVWVKESPDAPPAKICALGVAFRRWVAYHGLALNVSTDLTKFNLIVPCGIRDAGVTSLERVLQRPVSMDEARNAVLSALQDSFAAEYKAGARACD